MKQSSASYSVCCEPVRWEACRCIQLVLLGVVLTVLLALTGHGADHALLDGKHKCVPDRLLLVPKRGAAFAGQLAGNGVAVVSVVSVVSPRSSIYPVTKTNPASFDGLYLQGRLQLKAARVGREFGLLLSPAGDLIQELTDGDAAEIGIEYTDDWRGWHPLGATVAVTAGIGSVIDPEAARRPYRFYRLRGGR